jgi:hypothetical protein
MMRTDTDLLSGSKQETDGIFRPEKAIMWCTIQLFNRLHQ